MSKVRVLRLQHCLKAMDDWQEPLSIYHSYHSVDNIDAESACGITRRGPLQTGHLGSIKRYLKRTCRIQGLFMQGQFRKLCAYSFNLQALKQIVFYSECWYWYSRIGYCWFFYILAHISRGAAIYASQSNLYKELLRHQWQCSYLGVSIIASLKAWSFPWALQCGARFLLTCAFQSNLH